MGGPQIPGLVTVDGITYVVTRPCPCKRCIQMGVGPCIYPITNGMREEVPIGTISFMEGQWRGFPTLVLFVSGGRADYEWRTYSESYETVIRELRARIDAVRAQRAAWGGRCHPPVSV